MRLCYVVLCSEVTAAARGLERLPAGHTCRGSHVPLSARGRQTDVQVSGPACTVKALVHRRRPPRAPPCPRLLTAAT